MLTPESSATSAIATTGAIGLTLGVLSMCIIKLGWEKAKASKISLPPGPKGKPIVGNLFDLPFEKQWEVITQWSKEYGDVVHLQIANQHLIYLNSFEAAIDLLEKRSSIYSDRFQTPMMKLMGVESALPITSYGDEWRQRRRIFHEQFNPNASQKFQERQIKYAGVLVGLLLDDASSLEQHLAYFSAGVILESIYGFKVKPVHDPYLKVAQDGVKWAEGLIPGAFLVDALPFLKYIPEWMPGASFQKKARYWGQGWEECCTRPFDEVRKSFDEGTAQPSFMSTWLSKISDIPGSEEKERVTEAVRVLGGAALIGGYETTSSSLLNFILCMVYNPDVQRKAQQELDEKIGRDRLPDFSDREDLPYVEALAKEVMRWLPNAPLGIPHLVTTEDEYKGMRIPKGSIVFGNAWAMSRNEDEYGSDVESFRPERFLSNPDARDPSDYVFGYGRRICPGRHMAKNSIFIVICYALHLLWIEKEGPGDPPEPRGVFGMLAHLLPFPCSFKPRFEGAEKLIDALRLT